MKKYIKCMCLLMAFAFLLQGCGKGKTEDTQPSSAAEGSSAPITQTADVPELGVGKSEKVVIRTFGKNTSGQTGKKEQKTQQASQTTAASTTSASSTSTTIKTTSYGGTGSDNSAPPQKNVQGLTYINGVLIVNKSYSIPSTYNPGVDPTAQSALNAMTAAAAKEGINLFVVSGFRSYSTQESIYNNYVAKDGKAGADRYSARPGHSEHQTGLAFDLNSLSQSFENTAEGKWLAANCYKYGFIIRFPKGKESITGYMYEPWHVRYLGTSTATAVYNSGKTLEEYLGVNSVYAN